MQLTFPPETVTKTASAAALPFAQTTMVTVSVLDPTTHKKVVPSVTQARPVETRTINGPWIIRKVASSPKTQSASELAYNMTVTIPGVPAGTYLVYVQCFNDSGASCGDTVPQAVCLSGETVIVPVTETLALVSVAVTPATATITPGGTQQLTATATYSDNSKEDATYVATWTAFDVLNKQASASAAVDVASTTGLVTGVSVGIAEVFAKVSGVQSLPAQITVGGVTPTPPLAWSTPPANLTATGQGVEQTQVAVSADGTKATAVWQRNSPNGKVIQTASAVISGNTATWGPTYTLFAFSGRNGQRPQIAVSADGTRATAVWVGSDGANTIVESASATISGNAATWGSPTDLAAAGQNSNLPQLGLSADGTRATAVWFRYDGSDNIIQTSSYGPPSVP